MGGPSRTPLLVVTHYAPVPLDNGGSVRVDGMIRSLAKDWDLTVLLALRPGTDRRPIDAWAAERGVVVDVFDRDPDEPNALRRWLRAVRVGAPPWVLAERSAALSERIVALTATTPAVVLLDDYAGINVADLRRRRPGVVILADKHRVLGVTGPTDGVPLRARIQTALGTWLTRRYERRAVGDADGVWVTSAEEAERLEQLYGRTADAVLPSAADVPAARTRQPENRVVGWLGLLDYGPNVEGLRSFLRADWPELVAAGCRMRVAGKGSPDVLAEIGAHPSVEALGFVEDLDAFLGEIAVGVVPLWQGAGVKLKTVVLLGAGVPAVVTPVAVEGIAVVDGVHCAVVEEPGAFAGAVLRLLADGETAGRMGASGAALVRETLTWDAIGARVVDAVTTGMAS